MTAERTPNTLGRRDFFKLGVVASAGGVLSTGNAEAYPEFRRRLRESDCQRCALAAGRRNIVVDRGNPDAAIIGIGDWPGRVGMPGASRSRVSPGRSWTNSSRRRVFPRTSTSSSCTW